MALSKLDTKRNKEFFKSLVECEDTVMQFSKAFNSLEEDVKKLKESGGATFTSMYENVIKAGGQVPYELQRKLNTIDIVFDSVKKSMERLSEEISDRDVEDIITERKTDQDSIEIVKDFLKNLKIKSNYVTGDYEKFEKSCDAIFKDFEKFQTTFQQAGIKKEEICDSKKKEQEIIKWKFWFDVAHLAIAIGTNLDTSDITPKNVMKAVVNTTTVNVVKDLVIDHFVDKKKCKEIVCLKVDSIRIKEIAQQLDKCLTCQILQLDRAMQSINNTDLVEHDRNLDEVNRNVSKVTLTDTNKNRRHPELQPEVN